MLAALTHLFVLGAVSPTLALVVHRPPGQELPALETYAGPHCSFSFPAHLAARDLGLGWGVAAELFEPNVAEDARTPWVRVTSVRSGMPPSDATAQLLELDREALAAAAGWALADERETVRRIIDGSERSGVRIALGREVGPTTRATYTLYAWSHDGSVNLVRTVSESSSQDAVIEALLDGLSVPGVQPDSQRQVGPDDFAFHVPATWETISQELETGFIMSSIAMTFGKLELLHSPQLYFDEPAREQRDGLIEAAANRMEGLAAEGQGELIAERRAWLNVDGELVEGLVRSWRASAGDLWELPNFVFAPQGTGRAVQLQPLAAPGTEVDVLAELTRVTRLDVTRTEPRTLESEELSLDGLRVIVPRGLVDTDATGDTFAGGRGAVFGKRGDGGPRWFFWSLPGTVDGADLAARQSAWMEAWLERDFPGGEVAQQQTLPIEPPLDGYQGLAWTVDHAPVRYVGSAGQDLLGESRRWMCALVAIPFPEHTLLAALQVDDRDKQPMLDDFREAVRRAFSARTFKAAAPGFHLELPHGGPWALLAHPDAAAERFVLLHEDGRVHVRLEHFSEDNPQVGGPEAGALLHEYEFAERVGREYGVEEHSYRQAFTRIGQRDLTWSRREFNTLDRGHFWLGSTGWIEGDTRVSWSVESNNWGPEFSADLRLLIPEGEGRVAFGTERLPYGGLSFPSLSGFDWEDSAGREDRLRMTFGGGATVPVAVEFRADPGAQVSDEELLLSLLPAEPTWQITAALHVEDVEREVFGAKRVGKRRTGKPVDEPVRRQAVFVDRRQGIVRVLVLDGPEVVYKDAEPLLSDLIAAIVPLGDGPVLNPDEVDGAARAQLTTVAAGPFEFAVPADFAGGRVPDSESWAWTSPIGLGGVELITWDSGDALWSTLAVAFADTVAASEPPDALEAIFGEGPVEPHTILALVDGRVLPGFVSSIDSVPVAVVGFSHAGVNYVLKAQTISNEGTLELLRNALTSLRFEADD